MSQRPTESFIQYESPLPPPGAKPKPRPKPPKPMTTLVVGEEAGQVFHPASTDT